MDKKQIRATSTPAPRRTVRERPAAYRTGRRPTIHEIAKDIVERRREALLALD